MQEVLPKDTVKFGPRMSALNPRQQAFVVALWEYQPISNTEAVRRAGYEGTEDSHRVQACRLMQREDIKEAILEYGKARLTADSPQIYHQLLQMAMNPQHKDAAKIALALFGRAGFTETIEKNVNVNITLTEEQKIARIKELAAQTGVPLAQVLGNVVEGEVLDEEYEY